MGWSDLIGRQLGHYTIVDELGRGGSSRVYRGEDLELLRPVAIKVIFNDAEDRIGFIRRFEREVQAVAQLDHPNIVAVYDHGETDDLVYLVMRCVTGGTLRQRCGRPIPVAEAAAIIVQMCRALHHAHQNGIIHRDVKPSNMLVDADDPRLLLLTDFGIAKLQGMLGLTKSGTTVGTPEYMSPEQAEGKDIDQRTDVYALGCVLYELLAGRPPFVGSTAVSVLYQQVHLRPPHLRAFNSEVPREIGRIVEQALAKHPEERFGTAALLAEVLYPYAEGSLPPHLAAEIRASGSGELLRDFRASGPLTPYALAALPPSTPVPPVASNAGSPLPETGSLWQSLSGSGELVAPAPETWEGLGTEGLDAIFPDDPEAWSSHDARVDAITNTPTIEEMPSVVSISEPKPQLPREFNRSIPLPSFRLPSKETQPLNLPLTASGRLDIEALMAQVEAQSAFQTSRDGTTDLPPEAAGPAVLDYDTDEMGVLPELETPRPASTHPSSTVDSGPPVVWRPPLEDEARPEVSRRQSSRLTGRHLVSATAIAAMLSILLILGVIISMSTLSTSGHGKKIAVIHTPIATATVVPSPTVTPRPRATATVTVNPQQILNNEAATSFESVTLSQFADNSCSVGNGTIHFGLGQTVYINLCTSGGPVPGPVTVTIRQGGLILHTLVSTRYLSSSAGYFYFWSGPLPSGSYDMVVTMPINGQIAVARDLFFTIG